MMSSSPHNYSKATPPIVSFEFFPPKTPKAAANLWHAVECLAPMEPSYISVTYGAGGSTRQKTMDVLEKIYANTSLRVAGHLTCVGATREETLDVARTYADLGVRKIVALRGDPPKDSGRFTAHPDGFSSAAELVAGLKKLNMFELVVGAYPERHPEATTDIQDIENLKRKFDAGADCAITQFFFNNDDYYRFLENAEKFGIQQRIIPGILPVENFERLKGFAAMCAAKIPTDMQNIFENACPSDADKIAHDFCVAQCEDLCAHGGVEELHFYTLNKPGLTHNICMTLGVQPNPHTNIIKQKLLADE